MSNLGPASTYRNRQPKGRPIGGQFANTEHGEAGISLADLSPAGVDVMAIAQDAALFWQDRYGQKRKSNVIDAEDIAQATLVEVLKAVKAGKPITNMRQFVNSVAANLTVRAVERFRPENQRARRLLEAKKDRFQEVNKRQPTSTEEKALIEEVNAEWLDPRHKPTSDWHIPDKINASLDKPVFDDGGGPPRPARHPQRPHQRHAQGRVAVLLVRLHRVRHHRGAHPVHRQPAHQVALHTGGAAISCSSGSTERTSPIRFEVRSILDRSAPAASMSRFTSSFAPSWYWARTSSK